MKGIAIVSACLIFALMGTGIFTDILKHEYFDFILIENYMMTLK